MITMSAKALKDYKEIDGVLEYRPNKFRVNFDRWLMSWADLVDGVVGVLSFGLIRWGLDMKLVCYQAKRNLKRMIDFEKPKRKEKEYHQRPGF